MTTPPSPDQKKRGPVDVILGLFSKVEPGEAAVVLLMMLDIFLVLLAYYIIKVAREPLVQTIQAGTITLAGSTFSVPGGAELKQYGSAAQALVLMAYVPFYSWFSSRVDRMKLIVGVTLFFIVNIILFSVAIAADVPYIGFAFFVWVGIFSLSMIAQFWSYANDIYSKGQGDRLFPIIGVGMTAGPPVGSYLGGLFFDVKAESVNYTPIMLSAIALLGAHLAIFIFVNRRASAVRTASVQDKPAEKMSAAGGFSLVLRSPYLRLIALLLFLLNLVNTTGEYILGQTLEAGAAASGNPAAFYGEFYSGFHTTVNIIALVLQAVVVSRLVKFTGIAGVVLMLPLVSLGAYGLIAGGAGLVVLRWAKTAENATDYSVMNTAKGMLWLVTSREEKYKAKQAIDTFVVRLGDVASAVLVFVGLNLLGLNTVGFAAVNIVTVGLWLITGYFLIRAHRRLAAAS